MLDMPESTGTRSTLTTIFTEDDSNEFIDERFMFTDREEFGPGSPHAPGAGINHGVARAPPDSLLWHVLSAIMHCPDQVVTWSETRPEEELDTIQRVMVVVADRKAWGKTAWSCNVNIGEDQFSGRYWFDESRVHNAIEDVAEVALKQLTSSKDKQPSFHFPWKVGLPLHAKLDVEGGENSECRPIDALIASIKSGNYRGVEQALLDGADVNEAIFDGSSVWANPLMLAISRRNKEVIKTLLKAGADVNKVAPDLIFGNVMIRAVCSGDMDIVRILLEEGTGVDVNKLIEGRKYGSALIAAAYVGDMAIVNLILRAGADVNLQAIGGEDGSALISATRNGDRGIIKQLLKAGADVNLQVTHGTFCCALSAAICYGDDDVVSLLLEAGAQINVQIRDGEFGTALIAATSYQHTNLLERLLKFGADVNLRALHGKYRSALVSAVCGGNRSIIKLLLKHGADVNMRLMTGMHKNALDAALYTQDKEIVQIILDAGAQVTDALMEKRIGEIFPEYSSLRRAGTRTIVCEWELPNVFLRDTEGLDLPNMPTLTKKKDCVLLAACVEYLQESYDAPGADILTYIVTALKNPDGVHEVGEIKVKATTNQLNVSFPESLKWVSDAVIWLCLTFRKPPSDASYVSTGTLDGYTLRLKQLQLLEELATPKTTCWSALFGSSVITLEPSSEANSEWGLALSSENMIQLAAVEYPVLVQPGVVLMGYSTALIPVRRRDMQTIEWHLEVAMHNGQLTISELNATKGPWLQTKDINELRSKKNILGWCPDAEVVLGTSQSTTDTRWSDAAIKHTTWRWTGANLQLLAQSAGPAQVGGQLGFTFTRSFNIVRFDPATNYLKCLRNSIMEQIVVYDTTQQRAWLVPLVCVLHQMLLSYSKSIPTPGTAVPLARPGDSNNGGLASFEALKDNALLVIERSGGVDLTIRDLVMGFSVNLAKTSLQKPNGRKIFGYELMDIVMDSPRSELKQKHLDKQGLAWSALLGEINCLFCSNFGDAIIGNRALHADSPCNRVPHGRDLMAASTCSISALLEKYSGNLNMALRPNQHTSINGQAWALNGSPFQQCLHPNSEPFSCWAVPGFLQEIREQKRKDGSLAINISSCPNGAVVFGCRETRAFYAVLADKWM
ncbi:hypothetical protein BJX63DRAFT_430305 [Aspergillus granulosus]|uniref:Uncharacterized protein n=1 Tax=Aspergillus granulosus TaxID=176169 RepID=A0ABR4HNL6_9EURO